MKKIISMLSMGALLTAGAFAEIAVAVNYRNGIEAAKFVHQGDNGRVTDEYGNIFDDSGFKSPDDSIAILNQTGWNGGKDAMSITASGDLFTLKANIQPTVTNNVDIFHAFTITADMNSLVLDAGWNGDGAMAYRVKADADAGNEEGKVFETYKLGSPFAGSAGMCSNNQISFNTDKNYYARAAYSFKVTKKLSTKVTGVVMFDRKFDSNSEINGGNKGWALFLNPTIKRVGMGEFFVKGLFKQATGEDLQLVMGGYVKPIMFQDLADAAIGGSVVMEKGILKEYNADIRLQYKLDDKTTITSFNKFGKLIANDKTGYGECDGAGVGAIAGLTGWSSSQILWNFLSYRRKIDSSMTAIVTAGQLTDLDSGFHNGRDSKDGTMVFVHPHAQFYANGGATITAGVVVAAGGIGADETANKDVDLIVNVPVMFRVKL